MPLSHLLWHRPETWKQAKKHSGFHPKLMRMVTATDQYGTHWPDLGIVTAHDYEEEEYEVAYDNGQFVMATEENIYPVKKGPTPTKAYSTTTSLTAKNCDPNPVMTMENRENIFIPANSRELTQMPDGPLKSLYMPTWQPWLRKQGTSSTPKYTIMSSELLAGTKMLCGG
ncbi:gamma-glutamylcyclotransferase [Pseudoscourfieldia marina]